LSRAVSQIFVFLYFFLDEKLPTKRSDLMRANKIDKGRITKRSDLMRTYEIGIERITKRSDLMRTYKIGIERIKGQGCGKFG